VPRQDPANGYNFLVSFVNSTSSLTTWLSGVSAYPMAGFSECSGLESSMQPEEHKEGGRNDTVLKFPSRVTWSNLRLRRGVIATRDLWQWYDGFVQGKGKRRDGLIVLQNDQRKPVRAWRWLEGMPVKWVGPSLDANQSRVAIEELEIAHHGLTVGASMSVGEAIGEVVGAVEAMF